MVLISFHRNIISEFCYSVWFTNSATNTDCTHKEVNSSGGDEILQLIHTFLHLYIFCIVHSTISVSDLILHHMHSTIKIIRWCSNCLMEITCPGTVAWKKLTTHLVQCKRESIKPFPLVTTDNGSEQTPMPASFHAAIMSVYLIQEASLLG